MTRQAVKLTETGGDEPMTNDGFTSSLSLCVMRRPETPIRFRLTDQQQRSWFSV